MYNPGSLERDTSRVISDQTFIFADPKFKVGCEGTVVAWEFCYRILNNTPEKPVIFFPSIWMPSEINGTVHYTLIQSSRISFTPAQVGSTTNILCPRVNLSATDQFTAPAGSVVGMYSYKRNKREEPDILRTNNDASSITTYSMKRNQSSVRTVDANNITYNVALRVHLGR